MRVMGDFVLAVVAVSVWFVGVGALVDGYGEVNANLIFATLVVAVWGTLVAARRLHRRWAAWHPTPDDCPF